MTKDLKIKILIYALVFLGVLNIATIGTIIWHVKQERKLSSVTQNINKQDSLNAKPFRRGRAIPFRRTVQELNLSPEQYQKFVQLHQDYLNKLRPLIFELRKYRELIDQELAKEHPNMAKIRRYSRRIGKIHQKLSVLQSEYYISLARNCSPQQRQKLYQIYRKSQVSPGWRRFKQNKN